MPMFMYSRPMRMPIVKCDIRRRRVSVYAKHIGYKHVVNCITDCLYDQIRSLSFQEDPNRSLISYSSVLRTST